MIFFNKILYNQLYLELKTDKSFNLVSKSESNSISEETKSNSSYKQTNHSLNKINNKNNICLTEESIYKSNYNNQDINKTFEISNLKKSKLQLISDEKESNIFSDLSNKLMNFFGGGNNRNNNNLLTNSKNDKKNINENFNINNNSSNKNNDNSQKKNLRASGNDNCSKDHSNNLNNLLLSEPKNEVLEVQKLFVNYPKIINKYNELDSKKKLLVEKAIIKETTSILREFIPHFANFNFEISEAIDLLVELSTKYKFEKEKLNFFVTFLNSNYYTIKNKSAVVSKNGNLEPERKTLKKNKIRELKFDSILLSLNYLDNVSKTKLLQINKAFANKNQKKIYYKILKNLEKDNKLSNELRLNLWKKILNVVIK